jgi:uncharacterized protein (DUF58 family)
MTTHTTQHSPARIRRLLAEGGNTYGEIWIYWRDIRGEARSAWTSGIDHICRAATIASRAVRDGGTEIRLTIAGRTVTP